MEDSSDEKGAYEERRKYCAGREAAHESVMVKCFCAHSCHAMLVILPPEKHTDLA